MNKVRAVRGRGRETGLLAAITLGIKVVAAGTTYVFTFVLAHTMDIADFGIVGVLLSATFLLSMIGVLGQHLALLRFVPPHLGAGSAPVLNGLVSRAFQVAAAGTTALLLFVSAATALLGLLGYLESWPILILGYLLVPLQGWVDMQAHLARAYRSIGLALLPKEVLWRGLTGIAVVAFFFASGGVPVPSSIVVGLLVVMLALLIVGQSLAMKRWLKSPNLSIFRRNDVPETWRSTLVPFWVSSVSSIMFANVDVVIVGLLAGGEAAGLYFAANRIVQVLNFFLMSQTIVIGPMVSQAHAEGRRDEVRQLVASATIQSALPTIGLATIMIGLAPWIMFLFGREFVEVTSILQVLSLSIAISVALGPSDLVLNMCGHERAVMIASAICAPVGVAVIVLFGWLGGTFGVAVGVLLARTVMKIVLWGLARGLAGVPPDLLSSLLIWRRNRLLDRR